MGAIPSLTSADFWNNHLEGRHATWGRADAVEVIATYLTPTAASGQSVRAAVERAADRLLRDPEVICLAGPLPADPPGYLRRADGMAAFEHHGAVRFTTRTTLEREALVLDAAAAGVDAGAAVVPPHIAQRAVAQAGLGADQADAVAHLLSGGERIVALVGPAGSGKSRSLAAARAGWEAAGYEVVGLAPSAKAASVLTEEAGMASDTLAKFLHVANTGRAGLTSRTVVVLDEASMAATADLADLVGHVQAAGAKLVLAGDDRQLGAVGAGGLFATLVADHGAAELSTVRRFDHAWERAASLRLRAGDVAVLPAYHRHGRILGGAQPDMVDAAFHAWAAARAEGRTVVVMAADNDTVDALALRARSARAAAGEVSERTVPAGRQLVGPGDEVLTLRNDRRLVTDTGDWVRNGQRWVLAALTRGGGAVLASADGHGTVHIPPAYLAQHLSLAYATTIHKAQGLTVDEGILLVSPSMTAESLYVGMTRGRQANRALVICETGDGEHGRVFTTAPLEVMGRVLRRPGAEASAHMVLRAGLARYDDRHVLAELAEEHARHIDSLAGPDRTQQIETLTPRADVAAANARLRAAEIEAGRAIRARELAETTVADTATPTLRAHLPGPIGERARDRHQAMARSADRALSQARHAEKKALAELSAARDALPTAQHAAEELALARTAQQHRLDWLHNHPAEAVYARDLADRLTQINNRIRELAAHRSPIPQPQLDRQRGRYPGPHPPGPDPAAAARRRQLQQERSIRREPPSRHLEGPGLSL